MPPLNDRQRAFDERRRRYLECVLFGAVLKGEAFSVWLAQDKIANPVKEPGSDEVKDRYAAGHITLCDVIQAAGLDALDRGLESIREEERRMPSNLWAAKQRRRLESEQRMEALARCTLVREQPERQDELFGWEQTGLDPESYWAPKIDTMHIDFLLDTADFGVNEYLRILYLLGETPEHYRDQDVGWRKPEQHGRDANFGAGSEARIREALLAFKYWIDDPFRADQFGEEAKKVRSNNPHENMDDGADMTYWSENHRILFATAEYLVGQHFPDEMIVSAWKHRKTGRTPQTGDKTGRQHMEHARPRVLGWLNERLRMGFSEWNAPGYYEEDLLPLLNLADFVVDDDIRTRAAMALDLIIFDMARFQLGGSMIASAGRAYFEHKNCGWEQSVRDSMEILFGARGHFTATSNSAIFFSTSPRYVPAEVVLRVATDPPPVFTDRSRVSIDFDEAGRYGVGFDADDDVVFWWSRAAYATKQTIKGTERVAKQYGLEKTPPFAQVLGPIESIAGLTSNFLVKESLAAGAFGTVGLALGGPGGAIGGAAIGAVAGLFAPSPDEEEVADAVSVISEGSVLSRANLYAHRIAGAVLASVQNFRPGQLNFQCSPCVAGLDNGAIVWTTYPSAGSYLKIDLPLTPVRGGILGVGGLVAGSILGPAGAIAGAVGAPYLWSDNSGPLAKIDLFGAKPFKDIHIEEKIFKRDDHNGPNWWTGNAVEPRVVQLGTAAIIGYKAKTIQKLLFGQRTHAWFPKNQFELTSGPEEGNCNQDDGRWFFGKAGDAYVGLFSAQAAAYTSGGPWTDKEILAEGAKNFFILQIGNAAECGSFDKFREMVKAARIHISGLHSVFTDFECSYDVVHGSRLELHYDDNQVRSAGLQFSDDFFPRFRNPFARVAWGQRRYVMQHAGASVIHDIDTGERIEGGRIESIEHDTPLQFYSQNMALLPWPFYKGIDKDDAIDRLAAILLERQPDVVGLTEMWTEGDRERLLDRISGLYPYHIDGPHEGDIPIIDVEISGGGLLLLSRHPITESHQTIYRQASGDDSFANKGVLHARVEVMGHPCPLDVFLSHTQASHPSVGGSVAGAREAIIGQIRHMAAFISACRDPMQPAILIGDLNVDSYSDPELYEILMSNLGFPEDLHPKAKGRNVARPDATSESDDTNISSFHESHPTRDIDDPQRFGNKAERLDYLLSFPGRLYVPSYGERGIVIHQVSPGRDLSDHYGLELHLDRVTQLLPEALTAASAHIALYAVRCLQTTSGPGDDEVEINVWASSGPDQASVNSPRLEDMHAGSERAVDGRAISLGRLSGELTIVASGKEIDTLSADDSLGAGVIRMDGAELATLRNAPLSRVMPLLTGDGGEYAVRVQITIQE